MNKILQSLKVATAMGCLIILTVGATLWIVRETELLHRSPPDVPASVSSAGAGRRIISTMDLQRELNRRDPELKLKEDGVYGPLTQAAHERAIGDQYAKELVVKEIR